MGSVEERVLSRRGTADQAISRVVGLRFGKPLAQALAVSLTLGVGTATRIAGLSNSGAAARREKLFDFCRRAAVDRGGAAFVVGALHDHFHFAVTIQIENRED